MPTDDEILEAMARAIAKERNAMWPSDANRYRRYADAALAAHDLTDPAASLARLLALPPFHVDLDGFLQARALTSAAEVEGAVVGTGSAAKVMGGPLAALQFLAEQLASRGRRLRAGDIVLTGMTTGIHEVTPGQRGRIVFGGVTPVDIAFVAAEPR